MECKGFSSRSSIACSSYWNISRMECKVPWEYRQQGSKDNWNISRMECKVIYNNLACFRFLIGIYPEWNVKLSNHIRSLRLCELEYIQNGM